MLSDFTTGKLANPAAVRAIEPIAALNDAARGRDDWRAAVIDELAPQPADIVVPKRLYSAFTQTDLDATCQVHHIDRMVLTGQHTDCCCRHTGYVITSPSRFLPGRTGQTGGS